MTDNVTSIFGKDVPTSLEDLFNNAKEANLKQCIIIGMCDINSDRDLMFCDTLNTDTFEALWLVEQFKKKLL